MCQLWCLNYDCCEINHSTTIISKRKSETLLVDRTLNHNEVYSIRAYPFLWDCFTLWYQCWEINHSTKKASRVTWNSWLFGAKSITQPQRSPIIEFDFVVVTDSLSGNELLLNQLHCGWVVDYTLNHYLFWFSFQMSVVEWLISQQCYWIQHSCGWVVDIKQWQWRKDTWCDIVLCVLLEY